MLVSVLRSVLRSATLLRVGVLLLVVTAVLGYTPVARGSLADLLALAGLAVGLTLREQRQGFRAPGFSGGIFLLAILLVLGVSTSPVIRQAAPAALKILVWVAVAHVLYSAPAGDRRLAARVLVITAAAYALVGITLVAVGTAWGELPGTQQYPNFPLGFGVTRFVGFYPTANDVALVFVLALFGVPLANLGRWRTVVILLLLAGLVSTWSRLLVLGLLAVALMHEYRGRPWLVAALLVGLVGAEWITHLAMTRELVNESPWVVQPEPFGRLGPFHLWSMGYLDLKRAALAMAWENPVLGVGLRGFGVALPSVLAPEIAETLPIIGTTPHSSYGMILAELGAVGVGVSAYLAYRLIGARSTWTVLWLALILLLGLAAIDYELQHHRLVYLVVALVAAARRASPAVAVGTSRRA